MNNRLWTAVYVLLAAGAVSAASVTDTIATGRGSSGVAVNPVTNRTYITNDSDNTVTMIDNTTGATSSVAVGSWPGAVAVNTATNRIYVSNTTSGTVSVINGTTNAVTATVTVGTSPRGIAVNQTTNKIYVANFNDTSVTVIDGATNLTTRIPAPGGQPQHPYAIAVNPVTNKIYVTNLASSGGDTVDVMVIDGATNATSLIVNPAGTYPMAIAVDPDDNEVYVANFTTNNVTVIDGAADTVYATLAAGTNPRAIAINPVEGQVCVANSGSDNLTTLGKGGRTIAVGDYPCVVATDVVLNKFYVVNSNSGTVSVLGASPSDGYEVEATLAAGTNPFAAAVNPVTHKAFVANRGSANTTVIDGTEYTVTESINTGSGFSPRPCVVDPASNKIYGLTGGSLVVLSGNFNTVDTTLMTVGGYVGAANPATGKIYAGALNGFFVVAGDTLSATRVIGKTPANIVVNPVTNKIYMSFGAPDSMVVIVDGVTNNTTMLKSGNNAGNMAVNPVTNKIYIANNDSITVIDGATNTISTAARVTGYSYGMALNPVTNKVYVANYNQNNVTVLDGQTNTATTVSAGTDPRVVAVNTVTDKIYVTNEGSASVTVIDGATNATATVSVGTNPFAIAVNPVTNKVFVANRGSADVTVIDGATNTTETIAVGNNPRSITVNPITGSIYVTRPDSNRIVVISTSTASNTDISTYFESITNNTVYSASTPQVTGRASANPSSTNNTGISAVLNAKSTAQSAWNLASISSGAGTDSVTWSWSWGGDSLMWGENFLCALTFDSLASTTNNLGLGTPFAGNLKVYALYRINVPTPAAPVLVSPAYDVIGEPVAASFLWRPSSTATGYQIQVSTVANFSTFFLNDSTLTDTSATAMLAGYTTYYWHVRAKNSGGWGEWSARYFFATAITAPAAPVLVSPADGETTAMADPTLVWSSVHSATGYILQIATNPSFSAIVLTDTSLTDTSTLPALDPNTTYYWIVRAKNSAGVGAWSSIRSFTTGTTAVLPYLSGLPRTFSITGTSTGIVRYSLPRLCRVSLKYYDLRGRLAATLVNTVQGSGYYVLNVKNDLPSAATYVRVFSAGGFVKRDRVTMTSR